MHLRIKCLVLIGLFLISQLVTLTDALARDYIYRNGRYNFTMRLPDSDLNVREVGHSDGASFTSRLLFTSVMAYGTMKYELSSDILKSAFNDMKNTFSQIDRERLDSKKGFFEIVGLNKSRQKLQGTRAFIDGNAMIIATVQSEVSKPSYFFDTVFGAVRYSIRLQ